MTLNGKNGRWITKENTIIVLLLALLGAVGNITVKVARIEQKVTDHIEWGILNETEMNDQINKNHDDIIDINLNLWKPGDSKQIAEIEVMKMKQWVRKNFVQK